MKIIGEYSIEYNIYTMFDVYSVRITNYNLITKKGYEFFLKKVYKDDVFPIEMGYYHDNHFYEQKNSDDTYVHDLKEYTNGKYSTNMNYIDKSTYKQYRYIGENFVDFNEKLDKICIGKITYVNELKSKPSSDDTDLYKPFKELKVTNFAHNISKLILKCDINKNDLNGTTEIGVKTNHGRLVSHDIHPPYNLPIGTTLTLEYVFKLSKED